MDPENGHNFSGALCMYNIGAGAHSLGTCYPPAKASSIICVSFEINEIERAVGCTPGEIYKSFIGNTIDRSSGVGKLTRSG